MPHEHPKDSLEAQVDAAAAAIGLRIPAESRAAVIAYYRLAAGMAATVAAVPLGRDDETGAVFTPVSPATPDDPLGGSA